HHTLHTFPTRRSSDLNGRNKLFWFFAWEALKDSQPNPTTLTVPTDAERQGNFSGLPTLYDPYSAVSKNGTITRTAIPGNNLNNRSEEHTSELQSPDHL